MVKLKKSKLLKNKLGKSRLLIFILIFASFGALLYVLSWAATQNVSLTASGPTSTQLPAKIINDSSAVGGKAFYFEGTGIPNGERLGISPGSPDVYLADGLTNATYMAKIAELGMKWVRLDANLYKSTNFIDNAISEAKKNNLKVLATFTYGDTSNPQALADKVTAYVTHWNSLGLLGSVGAYEIWNEPNNTGDPNIPFEDPVALAGFMKKAYPILKFSSPSLPVVAGGYAPGGGNAPCCNGNLANPADYLDALYKANGNKSDGIFDAAAIHPYSSSEYPIAGVNNKSGWRNTQYLRNVMNFYGDADKQIWGTEAGWHSCASYGSSSTPFTEAQRSTRFKNDMKDWFYGLHNLDGSPKGEFNASGGDWNTGPFIIYKLYKAGDSGSNMLGLIYTPSLRCDGLPSWYEPPIINDIKFFSAANQAVVNPTW